MKRVFLVVLTIVTFFGLFGCEQSGISATEKIALFSRIDEYINYNKMVDKIHDEKLDDVLIAALYVKDDFFNYSNKDIKNVELEYSNHYNAFSTLEFITELIDNVDGFDLREYYKIEEFDSMVYVDKNDSVITIDFYQYFTDLHMVSRQYFVLKEKEEKLYMERFSQTIDLASDTVLLNQKLSVLEDSYIETVEYIPSTMSLTYIHNSYEEQSYFKYKAFFDDLGEYTRETVEMYIDEYSSFVSYDIKDHEMEDYRVKYFNNGHRVLKYDVNVFNTKDTEYELTWNLLSVDGWVQVVNSNGENILYHSTGPTMSDYDITIQRDGYGKVNAYKMITGEITNDDITLNLYKLDSNITLSDLEDSRTAFLTVFENELESHGFFLSNNVNKELFKVYFKLFLETGETDSFINEYK